MNKCRLATLFLGWIVPALWTITPSYAMPADDDAGVFCRQVEAALSRGDFDSLEGTAQRLRNPDARFVGGNSQLYHFYTALGAYAGKEQFDYTSAIPLDAKRQLLERWRQAKPDSIAARIALAEMWYFAAWRARGGGYADRVQKDQWAVFRAELDRSGQLLEEVDPAADPHALWLLMEIAKGKPNARPIIDRLYAQAIGLYPGYYHYYPQHAEALQERWYGSQQDLATYVRAILRSPGGDDGEVAYSYLAFRLIPLNEERPFEATGLSWPLVKTAYATRQRRYGLRNKDWNALFKFAVFADDRSAALDAKQQVRSWDPHIWGNRAAFEEAVRWVSAAP